MKKRVLDLFSAAAGGWSLGMHRAGFETMAACENIAWRRALYQENNLGVRIYDDVRTLTAGDLLRDFGFLPDIIVGSPPCQDISSANTKGKGVEGERSGLYFEAIRIIGECRPCWFALENSSNLRTRGADAVLAALEALGYSCWSFVVRAGDIGANHERPRCWIIGCDLGQVADTSSGGQWEQPRRRDGSDGAYQVFHEDDDQTKHAWDADREFSTTRFSASADEGRDELGSGRLRQDSNDQRGDLLLRQGNSSYSSEERSEDGAVVGSVCSPQFSQIGRPNGRSIEASHDADAPQKRSQMLLGCDERREGEIAQCSDLSQRSEVGLCAADSFDAQGWRSDWSLDDLAGHLRVDDGLSSWLAGTRVAVGSQKGTSAASLIVEAFGDSVIPQIPEAIGRAMIRVEAALGAIYGRAA